ncbi:MAG: FecR domain-containing protein [Tannerella sp.]|jgi:ferric-dicitrate binding protein FerR (iron transport regulator)|nr:FecR domain-containing protein [Tannerella sp.]
MYDLISKYFDNTITSEEREMLFSAMMDDEDLRMEFASIQNIHALTALFPVNNDQADGIRSLLDFKQSKKKKSFIPPLKHIIGYAAAICVAVLSTWAITNIDKKYPAEEIEYEEISAPAGQRAFVKLHDGTTVWLNARSTLRYPNRFSNERTVELDGEAFFEVKKNQKKPFIVTTEKLEIRVLGTHFNVYAYKGRDEFKTSLLEGSVEVYDRKDDSKALFLQPNEQAELIENKLIKTSFDSKDFLLWREGIYSFDDVAFGDIIKKLELYYDITIAVNDQQINDYKFSGKFRQRDGVESVLRTMQKVRYFRYIKDDELNMITIK